MSKRAFAGCFATASQFYRQCASIKAAEGEVAKFDNNLKPSVSLKDGTILKLCGFTLATVVGSHWLADQASKIEWLSP